MLPSTAIQCALVLGVALFVLTRDYDLDLALVGLAGRFAEGVMGMVNALPALGFISAAQGPTDRAMRTAAEEMTLARFSTTSRDHPGSTEPIRRRGAGC